MGDDEPSDRATDTTRTEFAAASEPPGARSEPPRRSARPEASITTVRCAVPQEAAATMRLVDGGPTGAMPPEPPSGDRFTDEGEIARGGMSSVRRALDNRLLRRVAMKQLAPDRDFDDMVRFIEEAQITGQLDHPNIVPVYDLELDAVGLPTRFTMKLVRGQTLQDFLNTPDAHSGRGLERLLDIFLKICDAVAFAHNRGVVHRDLKPSNIMIGDFGQVYVMDWGVALIRHGMRPSHQRGAHRTIEIGSADGQLEPQGTLTGTPGFMAPEQAMGLIDAIDERTDVYGLGGILYQFLTHRPPHQGRDVDEDVELARAGAVPHPSDVVRGRGLPPGLCRIAMRALHADPAERYQTVEALHSDVEAFRRGGGWFMSRTVPRGTVIVAEGDAADAAYIITEGQCELHKIMGGERRFIRLMAAGEAFGETAIFGDITRTASVIAATEVTLLVVTRDALEQELDRNTWMRAFVEALAERFLELDRRVLRLEDELAKHRG